MVAAPVAIACCEIAGDCIWVREIPCRFRGGPEGWAAVGAEADAMAPPARPVSRGVIRRVGTGRG